MSRTPVYLRVKKYAVKAGIKKRVYPHLFRHSCISHMADGGATLPEIQRQSRHKDIKTLMAYIHPNEKKAKEAYLKTVFGGNRRNTDYQPQNNNEIAQNSQESVNDTIKELLKALTEGKISEETFKTTIAVLKRQKDDVNLGNIN